MNGTPGDCVMLGTTLWEKVDLVLSGINIGTNLGNAIWHSGHARRREAGGAARPARHRVQRAGHRPRAAELRAAQALGGDGARSAARGARPAAGQRQLPGRGAARHAVDAPVGEALRRQGRSRQGPDGPHALLVHRGAGRGDRGRHRPLGDRAGLRVDDAAAPGPHRRRSKLAEARSKIESWKKLKFA